MPRVVTLGELRSRVLRLADVENSSFVATQELDDKINSSLFTHWARLCGQAGGRNFYRVQITQATTANQSSVGFQDNVWRLLRVDTTIDGVRVPMLPVELTDHVIDTTPRAWDRSTDIRYVFQNASAADLPLSGQLQLFPTPNAVYTLNIDYIRAPDELITDSNTLYLPWDEWIEIDAAIQIAIKEQNTDAYQMLVARRDYLDRVIDLAWTPRDNQATGLTDIRSIERTRSWDPAGGV